MNYLVFRNGEQHGPHSWPELQEMLAQGTVAGTDQVRPEAGGEWSTLAVLAASHDLQSPPAGAPGAPAFASIPAYAMPGLGLSAAPTYQLFDSRAVAIATLLGTPVAGAILMALNYRRLGQKSKATLAVVYGIVATALATGVGFFLPQGVGSGVGIGLLFATMNVAKSLQGPAIEEHQRQGGKLASRWIAFFVGLGMLVVFVGIVAVVMIALLVAKPA
jgi:hypothetical protein